MISIRVNEIFNYLSTDRKKDKTRTYSSVVENDSKEKRKDSRPAANVDRVTPQRRECGGEKNSGGNVQPTSGSDSTGKNSPTDCMADDFFVKALETGDCETVGGHSSFRDVKISSPFPEFKFANTACKSVTAGSRNGGRLKVSASDASTCIASQRQKPPRPTTAGSCAASSTDTPSTSLTNSCKTDNKAAAAASSKLPSDIPEKRAAAHPEPVGCTASGGAGSAKSRKKRNRRNGDRCSSAATLDFRSAEKSATLPAVMDRYISGTKSFSAVVEGRKISAGQAGDCAATITSTPVHQEAEEICCEGEKALTGRKDAEPAVALLYSSPLTTSCFGQSAGDELLTTRHETLPVVGKLDVSKSSVIRVRTVSGMDDLDTFDQDIRPMIGFVASVGPVAGILDPHKIDALDDFEDLLPSSCSSIRLETLLPQEGAEWTAVNRRCKKVVVSADVVGPIFDCQSLKIDEIARSTGAHIELDQHVDKVTVIIRGSAEQIHAACNLVMALTASQPSPAAADVTERSRKKKNRNRGGSRSKKATSAAPVTGPSPAAKVVADRQLRAAAAAAAAAATVASSPPKCVSVGTETDFVSPCKQTVRENRNRPPTMEDVESSAVKEYSLFDNHFSRSVELVMRRDSPLYVGNCSQLAARAADALPSRPAADLALLAKAPGYRTTNTSSPFSSGPMYEIIRKNSDASSSSSSISSCGRSAEEVVLGSGSPVVPGPVYRPLPDNFVLERPRSTPQQRLYGRNSPPTASHQSFPLENGRAAQQDYFLRNSRACDYMDLRQCQEEQYSSQHQPMTLPRIETDLNPNAPDFVYQPVSSARISKPLFSSSYLANGSVAMPSSSPTSYLSGRYAARDVDYWSFTGDGFGVGPSGIGDLLSSAGGADAVSSSPYGKFLPSTPINIRHQWASPGVCQESLTFG